MMEFVTAWLWYLVAFALGALVAWLVARSLIEPTSEDEAFADVPESRALEGRS